MLVLGIETSGLEGSIALLRDDVCLGESSLSHSNRRHAQALVLTIRELLQAADLTARQIDLVAISRGPGSFTGLRVGMVCAKTLAYAAPCRFVAIDTFAVIAANVPLNMNRVLIVEDAQRDDLFVGEYQRSDSGDWRLLAPIHILSVDQFLQARTSDDVVTGPGLKKIDADLIPPTWLRDPNVCQPRASVVASQGGRLVTSTAGEVTEIDLDFWQARPFYLRPSAAEEKRALESNPQ